MKRISHHPDKRFFRVYNEYKKPLPNQLHYRDSDYLDFQIKLQSTASLRIPLYDNFFRHVFRYVMMEDGWKTFCSTSCPHRCADYRPMHICPHRERTILGFLDNWRVNPCLPFCSYFPYCLYRKGISMVSYKNYGDMFDNWDAYMEKRKIKGVSREYWRKTPASLLDTWGWKYNEHICHYLKRKVVKTLMECQGFGGELLSQLGEIEEELTKFKQSLSAGDLVVVKQIGFLLYMVELGKKRLGAVESLTVVTKNGEGFIPLVKDVKELIREAVALMDSHGWTTAGEKRLSRQAAKNARQAALDMLDGGSGIYESKALLEKNEAMEEHERAKISGTAV